MSASWAGYGLTWGNFNILPLIRREVVNRRLIRSIALLETSKDDHLSRLNINAASVFIPDQNLITSGSDLRPCHRPQIQIVQLVCVDFLRICIFLPSNRDVTSEEIHVVLVNARAMIGNTSRDVLSVSGRLNEPPAVIALNWVASWAVQLILIYFTEALQTELEERVEASFANIEATIDEEALIKYET